VAKAAADYGTYIELNAKKVHFTDDEIEKMLKTDVKFIVNSDAHSPNRVGEVSLVENMIKRLNFPTERIVNIDGRLPKMRFKSFKEDKR
jgi:putative hydrolase